MIFARGTAFQTIRFKQKTVGTGVPDGPIYETELQYIQIIREKETETWLTLRRIK